MVDRRLGCTVHKRQRLVLLLGAGSTIHAGVPSTDDVTKRVCALTEEGISLVVRGLREREPRLDFNFETVLAALEDLEEYTRGARSGSARETLSIFTNLSPYYRLFEPDEKRSSIFRTRTSLLNGIFQLFIKATVNLPAEELKTFIDCLRRDFDITVVTLNYDDLIDRAGDWFDGFVSNGESDEYRVFDPMQFRARVFSDPAVLLHLHGSIRFGRRPQRGSGIVKYESPEKALRSLGSKSVPMGGEAPIISGYKKERWLNTYVTPFGYYYNAFMNAALDCPLWIIGGYGGNDLHVSTWVGEHRRIYGKDARTVLVDKRDDLSQLSGSLSTAVSQTIRFYGGADKGNFPPNRFVDDIIAFLKREH